MIRGHLDSIILRLVLEKDRYGYEILKEISLRTDHRFRIKETTLYAVFQRLEKKELIQSYYGSESKGRKTKVLQHYYARKSLFKRNCERMAGNKEIINLFLEGLC
jgi:PadR family transcriptional regulator PadR